MRAFLCAFSLALPILAADAGITPAEARDGWILLFDGQSDIGWAAHDAKWKFANGTITFDGNDAGSIRTLVAFSDYRLTFQFRSSGDPDASLFLRIAEDGKPQETGYEVRLGDTDPKWPAGSVPKIFAAPGRLPANQWHTFEAELNGDKLLIAIDNRSWEHPDSKAKAGFISLAGNRGPSIEFQSIKLRPIPSRQLFAGVDMDGWKRVSNEPPPAAKPPGGGMVKGIEKVFKPAHKAKEADWTFNNGLIRGSKGPGQLESEASYDDFVLQLDVRINNKGHHAKAVVRVRGDAGKVASGYELPIDYEGGAGGVGGLKPARSPQLKPNEFITETIATRARQFVIWVNGYPVTAYRDPRPSGKSAKDEARTDGGPIALYLPDAEANLDFKNIKIATVPKLLGGHPVVVVPPTSPPPAAIVTPPPAAAPSSSVPSSSTPQSPPPPMIIQNPNQAKDDAKKEEIKKITARALEEPDPAERARLWKSVLLIDPTDVVANQNYDSSRQKAEQAMTQQQKTAEEQSRKSEEKTQNDAKYASAISAAQAAFLARNLSEAQSQLRIAQQIAPNAPEVQLLQNRLNIESQTRQRVAWLATGGGVIVLAGGVGLLIMALGKKDPYLEVVGGTDIGKRFRLDQDVVRIGAIQKDGDSKNEIVLTDVDRMISRFHCEIHQRQNKLFLVDVNSANGTFLDKKPLAPGKFVRLKKGSNVSLGGSCTLRIGFEKRKKA